MSNTKTFEVIKVSQPIGTIYLTKIDPNILLEMSVVDRRRIAEDDEILGVQRELRKNKVVQIKNYLSSMDATFPNSIIVDTTSEFIVNESNSTIEIKVEDNAFTIIDGQHRVEGFRDNPIENFELILAIFKDLETHQQANIFSTINSQQTKVDPSLNLHLEMNSEVYTPKKMMIEIAQSFCFDSASPWHNEIKMLGSKTRGIISLSAFVKPLLELTYPEKDYHLIRNELMVRQKSISIFNDFDYKAEKYIFWNFYLNHDLSSVYKILFNYFKALSVILNEDWLNPKSLLNKTTGYNALIRLFKNIVYDGVRSGTLTYNFFFEKLEPLAEMNGTINSDNYGASGFKASNELYYDFSKILSLE